MFLFQSELFFAFYFLFLKGCFGLTQSYHMERGNQVQNSWKIKPKAEVTENGRFADKYQIHSLAGHGDEKLAFRNRL